MRKHNSNRPNNARDGSNKKPFNKRKRGFDSNERSERRGEQSPRQPRPHRHDDAETPSKTFKTALSVVVGRNSVLDLLKVSPRRIQSLLVDSSSKPERRLSQIIELAEGEGIRIKRVPTEKLESRVDQWKELLGSESGHLAHQGILAEVLPKEQPTIYQLAEKLEQAIAKGEKPLVIALDKVMDPRNFGAILRVADGVGAIAVLTTERHAAGFSPAVAKTASGAEATVDVVTMPNLVQGLEKLKKAGAWVIGAAGEAQATYIQLSFDTPTVLVMGNEENGLGRLVTKTCDGLVKIPMAGQVESLNVSAATAVLAFHIKHQLGNL